MTNKTKTKMPIIAPSLLAADFNELGKASQLINESQADWFHLDVMDGRFVPNISFGFPIIEAVSKVCTKPLDVHLMIVEPEKYVERFAKIGVHLISVHYEACPHLHRNIQQIKALNVKAGVALNPHTPVSLLKDVLPELDLVCLMSVNPGFGGQKFIERTYARVQELKKMIINSDSKALIEIDGGVNTKNAEKLSKAGADVLVAGSSVFKAADPVAQIDLLKNVKEGNFMV